MDYANVDNLVATFPLRCIDLSEVTTFHIYLPAGPDARSRKTETRLIEPPHGEETILLVEDEEGMRSIVTLVLERHGYTVIAAASGREAQEILRTRGPEIALVLTDLIMPEMNGCELAESLLKEKPELKILLMSGYSDAAAAGGRPSAEAWAFLPKPFTPGSLACKVRAVLDQGRAPVEEFDLAGGATNQG